MKRPIVTLSILGLLATTPIICWATSSYAANRGVESALQNYGDLSMFYQALLNTGVVNELSEDESYTVFAPTNAAFSRLPLSEYPCFYAVQCRPEIAEMLRNHIVADRYDEANLVTYGSGIQSIGQRRLHVTEPFVNDYAVEGQKILSSNEVRGNIVYRIDGPIVTRQELSEFRAVPATTFADNGSVTTEKTTVRRTYTPAALPQAYPSGSMVPEADAAMDNGSETTTVIKTYTTEPR